jgi:hypothetical protein
MFRPWLSRLVLVVALLLVCPMGVQAGQPAGQSDGHLWATLEGKPLALVDVANYYCHDFAYPRYTCFRTAGERDRDLDSASAPGAVRRFRVGSITGTLGTQSVNYVLFFEHSDYAGSSLVLSNPTPDLGVLGWSNRISSFKSTNGGRPKWWDSTSYTGTPWQWGTSAWVAYVGNDANDRFTSVQNVP